MVVTWREVSRTGRAYAWSILLWAGFAPVMAGQEKVRLLERGLNISYWNCLLITGAWCITAALLAPPIFAIVRRHPIARSNGFRRIAAYVLGAVPYLCVSVCVRSILLPPWDLDSQRFTARSLQGLVSNSHLFAMQTWDYLVILVAAHAYQYFMRARTKELESAKLQQALAESELQSLKSQLQPHFLFNTLHGISTLIEVDKASAKAMILKLSGLLRTALQDGATDLITLDDELKFAEAYLDIEKMRLGSRLEIRWKVEAGAGHLLVPQLILQPLVENAIVHGVACSREGGWLEIGVRRLEGEIELSVRNCVCSKSASGSGLGLRNTKARLRYLYADEASSSFAVAGDDVAAAIIRLPALGTRKAVDAEETAGLRLKST